MANLKFADTHNLVVFLSKPIECKGFEQIVDFLNAHLINYALTVNPTIYTSCINQFWSTGVVKTIDGEVQLHALVDGKKIIISKASMRRDLKLEDEDCVDWGPKCKDTPWNEFSSTMASAIICLDTNQKFNFSKYIFECMVRNLDNVSGKFLMYPRFVQVFLDKQVDGMASHKRIYIAPSHTKKIFRNMKRVGKGFFGRVTPLFPSMVVQNQSKMGEGSAMPTDPHHTPTITQSSPQPQKTQKPRKPKRKDTQVPQPSGPTEHVADEAVHKERGDSLVRAATTASSLEAEHDSGSGPRGNTLRSDEDSLKLKELMELCTNLQQRVIDLEQTKTTQAIEIDSLKRRVKKLKKRNRLRTHRLKRLYKVGLSARVESSGDEEDLGEDASKQGRRINVIDAEYEITLVSVQDDADAEMLNVGTLTGDEVFAKQEVAAKDVNLTIDEVTLAQALVALKSVNPKVKWDVIKEPSVPISDVIASTKVSATTTTTATIPTLRKGIVTELGTPTITRSSQQPSQAKVQDKGKGKMVEPKIREASKE
ncbi:hypothetical protein Tco_0002637 [Tanacetum coccineum]